MMNQSERDCSTRRGGGCLIMLSRKEGRRMDVTCTCLPLNMHQRRAANPIYLHATS